MRVGSEKTSYFSNPAWPANDSSLQFATHNIKIEDDDVCQVCQEDDGNDFDDDDTVIPGPS